MFESIQTVHWLKKGPLAIVWTAASLNEGHNLRSKLNRRKCVQVDITEVCQTILSSQMPLSLRLSSRLMLGIVRIHLRQTHFTLIDSEYLKRRFEVFSAMSLDCQARPEQITFPEPNFNASFSSISDIQSFDPASFSPMTGYFTMDIEVDRRQITSESPSTPLPRTGSIRGTPPSEQSFIADPKEISIEEREAENNSLETSLMDSMYFGDEDPMLVTPCYKKSAPTNPRVKVKQQDLVLLFDDSSNSFSFSDGGGAVDMDSPNIVSPMTTVAQQKTQEPPVFESPFVVKNSTGVHQTSSKSQLQAVTSSSPHKPTLSHEDFVKTDTLPKKRRRRKREKFCPIDSEISLSRHKMKAESGDVKVFTRGVNPRAAKIPKRLNPKNLLFQMYSEPGIELKLAKSLLQPPPVIEKTDATEFTLDDCQPLPTHTTSTKPMLDVSMSDGSVSCSIHSELEVVRGGSQRDDLSYDDPFTNASAISGDSTLRSSRGHSFQFSTSLRLKGDVDSKDLKSLPPLVTGGLSPIMDIDEDMKDISGTSLGAMPSLDDSMDYQTRQKSSPFIERNHHVFSEYLSSILEARKQVKFEELLPTGSTRKTAGIAFRNILTILSNSKYLEVEQATPYGSILLKKSALQH